MRRLANRTKLPRWLPALCWLPLLLAPVQASAYPRNRVMFEIGGRPFGFYRLIDVLVDRDGQPLPGVVFAEQVPPDSRYVTYWCLHLGQAQPYHAKESTCLWVLLSTVLIVVALVVFLAARSRHRSRRA